MLLPGAEAIKRERERRHAATLRAFFEELACPIWPPWLAERDHDYHGWVRANWTIAASDRHDVLSMMSHDLKWARMRVLGQDLVDLGDDLEAIRSRVATDGHDVWELGSACDWRAWMAQHWTADLAKALERELHGATISLGWVAGHRERLRQQERERVASVEAAMRLDLDDEELRPYLERRVCGIRGRYRLMYTVWEVQHGITEADIDAP
jgi:hypothetical protein